MKVFLNEQSVELRPYNCLESRLLVECVPTCFPS